jgi:hypothetical protein
MFALEVGNRAENGPKSTNGKSSGCLPGGPQKAVREPMLAKIIRRLARVHDTIPALFAARI